MNTYKTKICLLLLFSCGVLRLGRRECSFVLTKKKKMAHFVDNKTECLECTSWVTKLKPVLVIT